MARKAIPEKHAPEKMSPVNASSSVQQPQSPHQHTHENHLSGDATFDASNAEQANLDELHMLFTSDLGWTWQPAETMDNSGLEATGILPWAPDF